jgi:hypothetical protein
MRLVHVLVLPLVMWAALVLKADQTTEKVGDVDIVREHDVMDGGYSLFFRVYAKAAYLTEKPQLLIGYRKDGKQSHDVLFNAGVVCKSDNGGFTYMRLKIANGDASTPPQLLTWFRGEDYKTFVLIGAGTAEDIARASVTNRQEANNMQAKLVSQLADAIMTLAGKVYIEYLPVNSAGHIVAEFDTSGMKTALAHCAECAGADGTKVTSKEAKPPAPEAAAQNDGRSAELSSALPEVTAVRFWTLDSTTRVAIEITGEVHYRADRTQNPERIFFDLSGIRPSIDGHRLFSAEVGDKRLKRIRVMETTPGMTRVVLELESPAEFTVSRLDNPRRMIIELRPAGASPMPH